MAGFLLPGDKVLAVDTTGIRVSIEGDRAIADAKRLDAALERLGRQGTQTENAFGKLRNSSTKTAGAFDRFKRSVFSLETAFKAVAVGAFAQQVGQAAISAEKLSNTLRFATGSAAGAADAIKFIREESQRLGLVARNTGDAFANLAAAAKDTALEGEATRQIFLATAEATTVLQRSAEDTEGILRAFGQSIAKGKLQTEELLQVAERGVPIFGILQRTLGKSGEEIAQSLQKGELIASEVLPKIAAEMRRTFKDEAAASANSLQAQINRLINAYDEFLRTLGEAGVIDAATQIIANLGNILFNVSTLFTRAKTAVIEFFDQFSDAPQTLTGTAAKLDLLSNKILKLSEQRAVSPFPEQLDEHIAELRAEYDKLQKQYLKTSDAQGELTIEITNGFQPVNVLSSGIDKLANSSKKATRELTDLERAQSKFNDAIRNLPARQAVRDLEEEFRAQEQVFTEGARLQEEAQDRVNRKLEESKQFVRDLGFTFSSAFETAILSGNKLSDVLRGLAQDILAITTRKLVTNPFAEAVGNIAGSLGGLFGGGTAAPTAPHMFGPKVRFAHQGGVIGVDAMPTRHVSPSLFDNAPRLHNGGLLSGEIPAILKRGEEVLTESNPRHRNNQNSRNSNVHIQIIDQRSADSPPVQVTQSQGPNGIQQFKVLIVETMKQSMGTGELDRTFANNFGLRRPGVSR